MPKCTAKLFTSVPLKALLFLRHICLAEKVRLVEFERSDRELLSDSEQTCSSESVFLENCQGSFVERAGGPPEIEDECPQVTPEVLTISQHHSPRPFHVITQHVFHKVMFKA